MERFIEIAEIQAPPTSNRTVDGATVKMCNVFVKFAGFEMCKQVERTFTCAIEVLVLSR